MAERIDDIVKALIEEGTRKGFLTYAEMNKLLEDQFLPPDKLEQVFIGLEEAGVDVIEDGDADLTTDVTAGANVATPPGTAAAANSAALRSISSRTYERRGSDHCRGVPCIKTAGGWLRRPRALMMAGSVRCEPRP